MSSYSSMTDKPLVEAIRLALIDSEIAFHRKRFMESETSASMSSDVEAIGYLEHEKSHPSERRILDATAALRAIEDAGWKVVPVEATPEMEIAATEDWMAIRASEDRAAAIWSAMLTHAPSFTAATESARK